MKCKIYTLEALADELGTTYQYLRKVLIRYQHGEIADFRGYKFFGVPNKVWYAYPKDADIELIQKEGKES